MAEQQIGKNTYYVSQFGALKGRAVFFRLVKLLGPMAAGLVSGDVSGLGDALAGAKEEDFNFLCDSFASVTQVLKPFNDRPMKVDLSKIFDDHFKGNYGELVAWLVFAVKVNFESFLEEIGNESGPFAFLGLSRKKEDPKLQTE